MRLHRRQDGFTLIELMITVAILGILASIAIPSFLLYQQRSKRTEAYTNLESIRKSQIGYFTEFGRFVSALPSPYISLSSDKQNWAFEDDKRFSKDTPGEGFELIGWVPDGPTFFDYDTNAGSTGSHFTAAAYGDVDGDGFVAVFLYVYPDPAGDKLDCVLCGGSAVPFTGPPIDVYGNEVINSVAPVLPPDGDDF